MYFISQKYRAYYSRYYVAEIELEGVCMNHGERCGNFMLVVVLMDTFVEKRPVQYRMQEVKA